MALIRDMSRGQLAFQVGGGQLDQFEVIRFRGSEGLCRLYRFDIDLACAGGEVAFDGVVGRPAVLSVNAAAGEQWFHGVISRFELTGQSASECHYRAELVPALWLLTHRYNSRVFQNKSVTDIIKDVLTQAGMPADRFKFRLSETHEPREYCVQYRETDYNFISRLMEEEGIWWCFEQSQEAHVLLMGDASSSCAPIEGGTPLPFQPPSGMHVEAEHVSHFRLGQCVRPGAVVLRDFNFENPRLDLQSKSSAGRDAALEFNDYPGEYAQQSQGQNLAKMRAEEFEAFRTIGSGQSNSHRLRPGRSFELSEHPAEALNGSYLVVTVAHQGKQAVTRTSFNGNGRNGLLDGRAHQSMIAARQHENPAIRELAEALLQIASRFRLNDEHSHRALTQWLYHAGQVSRDVASVAGASGEDPLEALVLSNLVEDVALHSLVEHDAPVYECRFECIPAEVTYRPPRITPWPVMRGSQTARVVGPSGEEIYCDKYGRVKVQFNWDREGKFDDKSSCWIRVSQGLAGGQYGLMFLPRVGQEVVVDFLEGDPDKPIITGRVYNADHMPAYPLPDEKTRSYIKTSSSKGGGGTNEIRFEDLKGSEQILLQAQKDLHVRVANDQVESIDHNHHRTVKENQYELVKKARHSEVKLDLCEQVGGKKLLVVKGDVGEEFKGNHSEKVGGAVYLKAGQKVVIDAGMEITIKAGGNFIKLDPSGVTIVGTMVKINSGGAAGSGTLVSTQAPEAPLVADKAKPGRDAKYSGGEAPAKGQTDKDLAGYHWELEEVPEKKTSWIEIELVDEEGQPVPNERYEVTAPDGKTIKRGSLNAMGQAHIELPDPGSCQIGFPDLDKAAWERA